jgi:FHA domain
MDTVTCSVCKKETAPGDYCKNCTSKLVAAVPEVPDVAVETGSTTPDAEKRCATPGCGQPLKEDATECRYCGEPVDRLAQESAANTLIFPWGDHLIGEDEALTLGREQPPFSAQLAEYPNVGRTHARVARSEGSMQITDLNSRNGTHIDGRRIPPGLPEELRSGQILRLGATLEIEVQ